tara:strand:+ start:118 stop:438 length:321 start_codon:yes stop_codon:yes gene_type:complete
MFIKRKPLILYLLSLSSWYEVAFAKPFLESNFLENLKDCMNMENAYECEKMIYQSERMQLIEYNRGNLKCQTSILGAQTELIRKIYFTGNNKKSLKIIIPLLIKNC